jgi:hypothetical protein
MLSVGHMATNRPETKPRRFFRFLGCCVLGIDSSISSDVVLTDQAMETIIAK